MDTQTVGLLERFAARVPTEEERIQTAIEWIKDEVSAALDELLDGVEELTHAQATSIKRKVLDIIDTEHGNYNVAEDSPIDGALSEFLRDEAMGVRPVSLVMTPQEFAAARADNAANAHRRNGPRKVAATVRQGPATKARRAKRA